MENYRQYKFIKKIRESRIGEGFKCYLVFLHKLSLGVVLYDILEGNTRSYVK